MLTIGALNDIPGVRHGFFTRCGGTSEGLYDSLNCAYGSGDADDKVTANRARAMEMMDLPADALVTARQVHSPTAVVVDAPWPRAEAPEADALVTRRPGLALGILTADCAPVLFAERKAGVIGAAHAGWRGAIDGVLEATVGAMEGLGAERAGIVAAIGPTIAQRSYEVGDDFRQTFLEASPANADLFAPTPSGRFLFDLPAFVARRLGALNLGDVVRLPCDTCREENRFFSYRRATLRGEPDFGRELSAIALAD